MVGVTIMRYTIELCKVGIVEAGILRVEQRKRGFFHGQNTCEQLPAGL